MIVLLGCGSKSDQQEIKIFRYNQHNGISSLDPAFSKNQPNNWAVNQLFNGLLQFDNSLNVKPGIAKSWEIAADKMSFTFYLRDDVYFHDSELFKDGKGRRVVASDFVYSFNRILDPATASTGAWIFNGIVADEEPFSAPDETTFVIRLKKPFIPFLGILTMQYCSVVPREVVSHHGKEFRNHPIGTGPFVFKTWEEGQVLLLTRNERYFEKDSLGNSLPYIDGVRISFLESKGTEFLKFKQGDLDFVSSVDESFINDVLDKSGSLKKNYAQKFRMQKSAFLNTEFLGILVDPEHPKVKNSPMKHKLIRQAINYGIDRKKMLQYLRNNIGKPANAGFVPIGLPSFASDKVRGYSYQPDMVSHLLKAAGFPNGKGLPAITLFTIPTYHDLCTFIQNQLGELAIPVRLEVVKPSFLRDMKAKGELGFFRGSWIADYPDAESFLATFYGKNPIPPNYTLFRNELFDALYEQSISEENVNLRYRLYQRMDSIVMEEAPVVPLYYDEATRFIHHNISGLENNPMNLLILKHVRMSDPVSGS